MYIAMTGIEGQSRDSDDLLDRPLRIRHEQKVAKYGLIAEHNGLQFAPTVFSQAGQVYGPFKSLIKEQIRRYSIKSILKVRRRLLRLSLS